MIVASNGLPEALADADWIFTGEGRMDAQTLRGKVPLGVTRVAGVPVIVLAGSLGEGYEVLYRHGIDAAFVLAPGPIELAEAMREVAALLRARARDVARLIEVARSRSRSGG